MSAVHFDRFDICAAYNLYSQLWGWDNYTRGIQARLHGLRYRAGDSAQRVETLSDNAFAILENKVLARHGRHAASALRRERRHGS